MKKIDKPKNTLVRKKKVTIDCLSEEQKYNLLKDYKTGSFTLNQLIEKYNLSSYDRLLDFINEFIAGLNIIKETNSINSKTNSFYSSYKPNNLINEPFFSLLSPPTDSLTDEEMTYCYLYVFTGDNTGAIEQSGLDAGLTYKRILKDTPTYAYAMKVRGLYLRNKPNIKEYIHKLREEKLKDNREVNKGFIIEELVEQLNELKESGRDRKLILETIKLLGQTCSAFTERIEIGTIDPNKPIDSLIEMAMKEANGTLLPPGSVTDVEYEMMEGDT